MQTHAHAHTHTMYAFHRSIHNKHTHTKNQAMDVQRLTICLLTPHPIWRWDILMRIQVNRTQYTHSINCCPNDWGPIRKSALHQWEERLGKDEKLRFMVYCMSSICRGDYHLLQAVSDEPSWGTLRGMVQRGHWSTAADVIIGGGPMSLSYSLAPDWRGYTWHYVLGYILYQGYIYSAFWNYSHPWFFSTFCCFTAWI